MSNKDGYGEYILKAKDFKVEISVPKIRLAYLKEIKTYAICMTVVGIFIFILYLYEKNRTVLFFSFMCFVIAGILYLVKKLYKAENSMVIENKKIYIYNNKTKYEIDFKNLVNLKKKHITEHEIHRNPYSHKKIYINYLLIEYLDNNQFKKIYFEYPPEIAYEINELTRCFITNKDLEENPNIYQEYFDIRSEELTKAIDEKKNAEKTKLEQQDKKEIKMTFGVFLALVIGLSIIFISIIIRAIK